VGLLVLTGFAEPPAEALESRNPQPVVGAVIDGGERAKERNETLLGIS